MSFTIGDPYQHRTTHVHLLDPRVKLIAASSFIVFVNLVPSGRWWSFFFLFLVILTISTVSRLGPLYPVRKSLLAAPFILAALAIPFTTQGSVVLRIPWFDWVATDKGLELLLNILARFWLAVQMAVLLASVTRVPDMLWALRKLGVPEVLVSVIAVMYRYLGVLGSEAMRMLRARSSRSCHLEGSRRPSLVWRAKVTGSMIGSLFLRAFARGERIHMAMLSRGYNGSPKSLSNFRMRPFDWLTLTGTVLVSLIGSFWVPW